MNIERIKHLVTNLLTGSSSTSERTELARWINSEDAEQTSREAWKNASEKIDASLEDEMWNEIRSKIEEATPQPAPTLTIRHRSYSISRIAASIAVILCSALDRKSTGLILFRELPLQLPLFYVQLLLPICYTIISQDTRIR